MLAAMLTLTRESVQVRRAATRLRQSSAPLHGVGGRVILVGAAVLAVALAGMLFRKDYADVELATGASFTAEDPWGDSWTFTSEGLSNYESVDGLVSAVSVRTLRNGRFAGMLLAETRQYLDAERNGIFSPSVEAAVHSTALQDVYMYTQSAFEDGTALLHIAFNPLVMWLYVGAGLVTLGGALLMWPSSNAQRETA
jgi:cytochrome c-type biogenesis protein CcmF